MPFESLKDAYSTTERLLAAQPQSRSWRVAKVYPNGNCLFSCVLLHFHLSGAALFQSVDDLKKEESHTARTLQ